MKNVIKKTFSLRMFFILGLLLSLLLFVLFAPQKQFVNEICAKIENSSTSVITESEKNKILGLNIYFQRKIIRKICENGQGLNYFSILKALRKDSLPIIVHYLKSEELKHCRNALSLLTFFDEKEELKQITEDVIPVLKTILHHKDKELADEAAHLLEDLTGKQFCFQDHLLESQMLTNKLLEEFSLRKEKQKNDLKSTPKEKK